MLMIMDNKTCNDTRIVITIRQNKPNDNCDKNKIFIINLQQLQMEVLLTDPCYYTLQARLWNGNEVRKALR